ncbi:MAG: DUF1573 domain-containing protein [Deltaproteobacteria bacterium]|nr:DUF1573 domain-containing protein [Deltaproteobacteria bacterium]
MSRNIYLLLSAFLSALLVSGSAGAEMPQKKMAQSLRPIMAIEQTYIDMGKVKEGDTLTASFPIKNNGAGKLVIEKIKSGCKCTSVEYLPELPAGETANIKFKIDTINIHGKVKFKSVIYSNDPERPAVTLIVLADIRPLLTLKPDRIFLKGRPGQDMRQEIVINTEGKMPLDVTIEQHDLGDRVKISLKPVIKNKQYLLSVESVVKEAGSFRGRIILNTNYPGRNKIALPVFVNMLGAVGVYPDNLELKTSRCRNCKGKFTGEILIKAQDDKPLNITAIEMPYPECTYEMKPLIKEHAYNIEVECMRDKNYSAKDILIIRTNRPEYKVIEVPVAYR